jgi:uncharacterized protein YcbX
VRITALYRYPVKSLRGSAETELEIEPWGPAGDRRLALVDEVGDQVTAREEPSLLSFRAVADPDGVRIEASDGRRLAVPVPRDGARVRTGFSRLDHATDAGDDAARFFGSRLGRPVRLVWQADPRERSVNPANGGLAGEVLSLADAGPLLLTSERSLARLQEWIGAEPEMSMERFRPNVVIDGTLPFEEDAWPRVRLGDLELRVQQTCDRCVMTTIDPVTLAKGHEPIRTLAKHRKWDGKTWFGVWLVPRSAGRIEVGDLVRPLG